MSRSSTLIVLGALTILAPLSGLPVSMRTLLTIIFGACVLGIGLTMRTRMAPASQAEPPAPAPPTPSEPQVPAASHVRRAPKRISAI